MLTQSGLDQFSGSQEWFRHALERKLVYTEGVQYMAEQGGAYWLIDIIASYQREIRAKAAKNVPGFDDLLQFQLWNLEVKDKKAVIYCRTDSGNKCPRLIEQEIEYTDFPLDSIKFYVEPMDENLWCLMLPSEH